MALGSQIVKGYCAHFVKTPMKIKVMGNVLEKFDAIEF